MAHRRTHAAPSLTMAGRCRSRHWALLRVMATNRLVESLRNCSYFGEILPTNRTAPSTFTQAPCSLAAFHKFPFRIELPLFTFPPEAHNCLLLQRATYRLAFVPVICFHDG